MKLNKLSGNKYIRNIDCAYKRYIILKINFVWLQRGLSNKVTLVTLAESWAWFPAPTWCLTSICSSNSKESNALLWFLWALGTHMVYIGTFRQTIHVY